ncbi:MAG: hypothetical protein DCE87_14510 [Betaproteobacteria bacterium]|jgi:hypothetical protein|nr:MAG: hypothetical protein DCE87_14510 [Betaproteobacteria bacterium]PZO23442.1 MAG: hypothetical protein DCE89_09935 [Betaproteobacteria bacterium]
MRISTYSILWFIGLLSFSPAHAKFELQGTKAVIAQLDQGSEVQIGTVNFQLHSQGKHEFTLELDHTKFTDFFLSMREFKCLAGETEVSCHVPYPYKSPNIVSAEDYAWLEHRLLFMFKRPSEFGAKLWNGIYFKFAIEGDTLVGVPQAVDLNKIGAPPVDLNEPPYPDQDRHDTNIEQRLVKALVIR